VESTKGLSFDYRMGKPVDVSGCPNGPLVREYGWEEVQATSAFYEMKRRLPVQNRGGRLKIGANFFLESGGIEAQKQEANEVHLTALDSGGNALCRLGIANAPDGRPRIYLWTPTKDFVWLEPPDAVDGKWRWIYMELDQGRRQVLWATTTVRSGYQDLPIISAPVAYGNASLPGEVHGFQAVVGANTAIEDIRIGDEQLETELTPLLSGHLRFVDGTDGAGIRVHRTSVQAVTGSAHVYATFRPLAVNPVPYVEGRPRGRQFVTLGQEDAKGEFLPAVRFGVHDGRPLPMEKGVMHTYLFDGRLDYYGMWMRPDTSYDLKLVLDLNQQRMTAWISGRGDDDWFLLAEDAPLMEPVRAINSVRVEQYPAAAGVRDLWIGSNAVETREGVRPHPRAKKDRAVKKRGGFRFPSVRSTWCLPARHVTVARDPRYHRGFADVVQAGPDHLVSGWRNGSHSGGVGGGAIKHSPDRGKTWSAQSLVDPGDHNCPRLQRLNDGTLLMVCDHYSKRVVLRDSHDGGRTWVNERWLDPVAAGGNEACVPSYVVERPDGSWLITGSHYPGGNALRGSEGEFLEFYNSADRGKTWKFFSRLQSFPPHSICEPTILDLPDGRLVLYARNEAPNISPAVKAFSADGGKTWEVHELPFSIVGRTRAGFLSDGRVMVTFRSCVGRPALWAWIGDPLDSTPFRALGAHLNDRVSVALKDGMLHIDSDGVRGQCTQYLLRNPDTAESRIDVTIEVMVVRNDGYAATLSVPYVGKLRLFPDRLEFAHDSSVRVPVARGVFHRIRVVREKGRAQLYVDDRLVLETDKVDARTKLHPWTPTKPSIYAFYFGNEARERAGAKEIAAAETGFSMSGICVGDLINARMSDIPLEVTGYSLWRGFDVVMDDPATGRYAAAWRAQRDGFPDQYQLDHIIEVEASISGMDQGYSGWVELPDGRIFVVNYTDDTAPTTYSMFCGNQYGIPWIRGTYVLPSDLAQITSCLSGGVLGR